MRSGVNDQSRNVSLNATARLRRLSVVFADPLRMRIVTELNMREMTPSGFHRTFGGHSKSTVSRHFKALAEHGWLRVVRQEAGRNGRRGGVGHYYRATELAVFDQETWEALPYPLREAYTWRAFEQLGERVNEALAAGTFDTRPDRHLSWMPVPLDLQGWREATAAMHELFESLALEQGDAKLRLLESGERPLLMTVALAGFESPRPRGGKGWSSYRGGRDDVLRIDSTVPFSMRMSRLFADPLSLTLVTELNLREMSASELSAQLEVPLFTLDRRLKELVNLGWLVHTGERTGGRRRGAVEHFYRAVHSGTFETDVWAGLPQHMKNAASRRTLDQLFEKVAEAFRAETIESRPERHVSWSLLLVDERGWDQVTKSLERFFDALFTRKVEAKRRLAGTSEEEMVATFVLAGFESPDPENGGPPPNS